MFYVALIWCLLTTFAHVEHVGRQF